MGDELRSFSFLSDRHVLLAVYSHGDNRVAPFPPAITPTLAIVDFTQQSTAGPRPVVGTKMITLGFPQLRNDTHIVSFDVRTDPSPSWQPDQFSGVPFYLSKSRRLYVAVLWVMVEGVLGNVLLFVPSRTLMNIINSYEGQLESGDGVSVAWADWGAEGTRMMVSPMRNSQKFFCSVYGTRYVSLEAHQRELERLWYISVYDFNDLPLRRGQMEVDEENIMSEDRGFSPHISDKVVYQAGSTTITGGRVFRDNVTTSSPFRWKSVEWDIGTSAGSHGVMCSEDNIIVSDVSIGCLVVKLCLTD